MIQDKVNNAGAILGNLPPPPNQFEERTDGGQFGLRNGRA